MTRHAPLLAAVAAVAAVLAGCATTTAGTPAAAPSTPVVAPVDYLAGVHAAAPLSDVQALNAATIVCNQKNASGGILNPAGEALAARAITQHAAITAAQSRAVVHAVETSGYCD